MTDPELVGLRRFQLAGEWEVLVGKTASDNDRLSLKIAHPDDYWFHVAGMPGSHVVARHPQRPDRIPKEIKLQAAGLAAFFSKGKTGGRLAVHITTCKNVSKRRGSPAGEVILRKFDSISAHPLDPAELPDLQEVFG